MYLEIQREHQETSPFVIMFQDIEVIAERNDTKGMVIGPAFDDNRYAGVTKE
jgi:peptide/nickel transport system substrate-binding protein